MQALAVGEPLDFWRVEEYTHLRKLSLRAEMKVRGQAWLEFEVEPLADNRTRQTQTARYYPERLFDLLYCYSSYPVLALVLRG
jgi:hypothetical protein